MGAFTSRQNAAVENAAMEERSRIYKFPPRSGGNFFGSHFIMGGERFDTPQPESYLFGENADLNFLGNRPTAFPYPPPQTNEPTKTLKSLVNIRKESVRFVRVLPEKVAESSVKSNVESEQVDGNVICTTAGVGSGGGDCPTPTLYNVEFTFDSDAKCAITIYYFCTEEVSPSGVTLTSNLTSETYHYEKGINQYFSQAGHIFNPQLIPEDDLVYNAAKEQYPVAIHCVVEEGNEDCRQSHTTICVIDHHDNNSYVLRALKQKIFVDGLCYLLQEIYGIENKAINKSSIDEDIDDHGSECVICMSDTRDTLILPCRHLCLCNSCADSLRYQANNCPICRAPFRALLQIRAVQKGISLHQNTPTSAPGEPTGCDQHIPAGYIPVSLIEALNGPPQYVARSARHSEGDIGDCLTTVISSDNHKATSPLKPTSQRRGKGKKNASTSTSASLEINAVNQQQQIGASNQITVDYEPTQTNVSNKKSPSLDKQERNATVTRIPQENLQIVNERHSFKLPKNKRNSSGGTINNNSASSSHNEGDEDSDTEKLSPLLSPNSKYKPVQGKTSISSNQTADATTDNEYNDELGLNKPVTSSTSSSSLKKYKRPDMTVSKDRDVQQNVEAVVVNAEDSDNYVLEDQHSSILSPLCPDRGKNGDRLNNLKCNSGSLKTSSNLAKKNLQKKSTSVGNIVGPATSTSVDLKGNVSSLPDMLDSPISGNSTSTRSSSDSYSSSSSTKQLLSSNPATAAANIIVDGDKAALQKAVNV